MLHRLTLRILPKLNAIVTEPSVRKRKRLVMLAPGLVAFLLYRLLKSFLPFSDPFFLLGFCGVLSVITALWAYRMGRGVSLALVFQQDGAQRMAWLTGWVGFAYGVQLSLLVLALLALFVNYNFLAHPDGPAMMALIIACTAVTRDAFEIGHVRRVESQGERILTFPHGQALRTFMQQVGPLLVVKWSVLAGLSGMGVSLALRLSGEFGRTDLGQTLLVGIVAASLAQVAFLIGKLPSTTWRERLNSMGWLQFSRFWIWPCFTFAMTYYLVQLGVFMFLVKGDLVSGAVPSTVIAGITTGLMACYGFFLGTRTFVETQAFQGIPENLQSCPFVMNILAKAGVVSNNPTMDSSRLTTGQPERMG